MMARFVMPCVGGLVWMGLLFGIGLSVYTASEALKSLAQSGESTLVSNSGATSSQGSRTGVASTL